MVRDTPELKINLLPIIYSQNSSMSLTQTDASIDYDRKLFLSKRGSGYRGSSKDKILISENNREMEVTPTKSQFQVGAQVLDGSDEESYAFSASDKVVETSPLKALPNLHTQPEIKSKKFGDLDNPRLLSKPIQNKSNEADSLNGSFSYDGNDKIKV